MEIQNLLQKNNKINIERRKSLNYLAFIKFLAMIKIIKWHIYKFKKKSIDYGARMCEILFISSGFLVGYNHYKRNMPSDYETSFRYLYKHLRNFYPLELILIICDYISNSKIENNIITEIEIFLSNILMIKVWSRHRKIAFSINAISWFLSVLIFCYFLAPIFLQGIRKIKTSIILFITIAFIRCSIDEILNHHLFNLYDAHLHRGPIIRTIEFYMGMLLIPIFFSLKYHLDRFKNQKWLIIVFTFIQIFSPIFLYYIMIKYNNKLHRCYFVLIFCFYVFIASLDYGFLSKLFSNKIFVKIMSCQMEMYLIQIRINNIFNELINKNKFSLYFHTEIQFLIKLIIIFIIGFSYRLFFREKFAKILDLFIIKMKSILF